MLYANFELRHGDFRFNEKFLYILISSHTHVKYTKRMCTLPNFMYSIHICFPVCSGPCFPTLWMTSKSKILNLRAMKPSSTPSMCSSPSSHLESPWGSQLLVLSKFPQTHPRSCSQNLKHLLQACKVGLESAPSNKPGFLIYFYCMRISLAS